MSDEQIILTREQFDRELSEAYREGEKTGYENAVRDIHNKRYFNVSQYPIGTIVEYDYSCGGNSCGVPYCITKARKTYLEGYSIIGDIKGDIRKFATNPKTIKSIIKTIH